MRFGFDRRYFSELVGNHSLMKNRADRGYRFYTADVFTDRVFGGNPLAVFPDARGLEPDQMRRIAREFNLSETVFVFPAEQPGQSPN